MPSFWRAQKQATLPKTNASAAAALLEQRNAVLKWTSDALALELESIKQVQNGAAFCQLFHILHAEAIDMPSVNFAAQSEFECLANYRNLQRGHSEMTKSKLLEWWRLIADEERAWELLAAMRTAVIDSGKLDAYSPLEAKHESKGAHLSAPSIPETTEAPSLPSNGVARISITRSGSLKHSPHSFVPGGGNSSFTTARSSAPKAHPNAIILPMPLSPRTPLEPPASPPATSAAASPAKEEPPTDGSDTENDKLAPALDEEKSKDILATASDERSEEGPSASQKSFLRAGSWKFNWPSKKSMASPTLPVKDSEKSLQEQIKEMKPLKVPAQPVKSSVAPGSPVADCRAAASAPFLALGSLLRRNNASQAAESIPDVGNNAGQPVKAALHSPLSGLELEQSGPLGSIGVPPNLMNATFVGEPPEEPMYALERVSSWKPAKDAISRTSLQAAGKDRPNHTTEAVGKTEDGATEPLKGFCGLETYKLIQVQPSLDPSRDVESQEPVAYKTSDVDKPAQPQPRREGSQAIEGSHSPHTPPIGSPLREPGRANASGEDELFKVKLRKVQPKEPKAESLPVPEQNKFSQVKLRRVGSKEADAPASATLPPIQLRRTPSKDVAPGDNSSAAHSPFRRASLRSIGAPKEAEVADANSTAPIEDLQMIDAAKFIEDPEGSVAHTQASLVKPEAVLAEQGVIETSSAERPAQNAEATAAAQVESPQHTLLLFESGQEQQDKEVSEDLDDPKEVAAVAVLPTVAEADQSGPSQHKEIEAVATMQAPEHQDSGQDQSGHGQHKEIEAVVTAGQAPKHKNASQDLRESPPAPALLRKSTFSQAMLRRVQSRNGQSGKAAVLGSNAKQPASPWGAPLKPVKQASENATESSASQDKLGAEARTCTPRNTENKNQSGTLSQVKLKSTPAKPAQEQVTTETQSTVSPFGVKLRKVKSKELQQSLQQHKAPASVTPESSSTEHTEPDAANDAEVPMFEGAESKQAKRKEQAHVLPGAEALEQQTKSPQALFKLKQVKRVEPFPQDVAGSAPMAHADVQEAAETGVPKPDKRAKEEDGQAVADDVVTGSLPAIAEAILAPGATEPDAGESSARIPAPADTVIFEDEKAEAPRSKSTKHHTQQHDIMADSLTIERVTSLPGAPKIFRGRKMWGTAVKAVLASKEEDAGSNTPQGSKTWTDAHIGTPKATASSNSAAELRRGNSLSKVAKLAGEDTSGTPVDKGPESSAVSKSSKSRKMWAKGVNAIRKEATEESASSAASGTAANGESLKADAKANEVQASKPKQKTWGASLSVWTSALKKLSEDPQAAKRRIEEQAAKEEAARIAEEARALSAGLIDGRNYNVEQLLGARGIHDKLDGIRDKYTVQRSEGSASTVATPARRLSSGLSASSLRRMSWSSRSANTGTPSLGRHLSNASSGSGSGKFEDPRRALRKKESWGEDWRAEYHISTLPETQGAAELVGANKEDGPSAGASAFSAAETENAEGERPKPLPAWLLRGVPAKQAAPPETLEDSEVEAAEQAPAAAADANRPKPSFGARLTGKAASAAPSVKMDQQPDTPPKVENEVKPQSSKGDCSAAQLEEDAVPSKKGGVGNDTPAAWQKKSEPAASSPSSSFTMPSAMQRAMQRRQSLRKPEGSLRAGYQRIKSMPREHNLAVRSIINASLEPTLEEQGNVAMEPILAWNDATVPEVTLRDKFGPSRGPLTVRISEQPTQELQRKKSAKSKQIRMASLDDASNSVMEGLKKKNRLWIFGRGSAAAQAV